MTPGANLAPGVYLYYAGVPSRGYCAGVVSVHKD